MCVKDDGVSMVSDFDNADVGGSVRWICVGKGR